jgi:hypothetical protein
MLPIGLGIPLSGKNAELGPTQQFGPRAKIQLYLESQWQSRGRHNLKVPFGIQHKGY